MIHAKSISLLTSVCLLALPLGAAHAQEEVTLTLLSSATAATALQAAIAKFQDENPTIKIEMSTAPDPQMNVLLPQQLAAGNGADLFVDWPGVFSTQAAGVLGRNGFTLDLSDEPWAVGLEGRMRTLSGADDKVYYTPLVYLGYSSIYNKTAMDAAGLTPPQTWDEVVAFCKAAEEQGLIPYALGAQTGSQNQMPAMVMGATLMDKDESWMDLRNAGDTSFADSEWVSVFDRINQMNEEGCFSRPLGTSEDVARQLVATGRALGHFGPSTSFKILQAMNPEAELVFASFPATNDSNDTFMAVGLGSGLSANADTQHPEEAKAFLRFMMEPENVNAYAATTSQVPAIANDSFVADDASQQALMDATAAETTAFVTVQLWPNPQIVPEQRRATQMMLSGEATPENVAEAMDAAWSAP
jgi:raffinose/stachyose/melibiose transport system substrate-binding protein